MSKTKYIVVTDDKLGELIFTFPSVINHNAFFDTVKGIKFDAPNRSWKRELMDAEIVSAGFVMDGKCFGRSESLNKDSRPDIDTGLLNRS